MPVAKHDYDLFVMGAGSGGVRAARVAAMAGAKVAVAEEDRVGGHLRHPRLRAQEVHGLRLRSEAPDRGGRGLRLVRRAQEF